MARGVADSGAFGNDKPGQRYLAIDRYRTTAYGSNPWPDCTIKPLSVGTWARKARAGLAGVDMATTGRNPSEAALLTLGLELLAVGLFTLLAGAGNDMGTVMVVFMVGLWILFLTTHSAVIAGLEMGLSAA